MLCEGVCEGEGVCCVRVRVCVRGWGVCEGVC